MYQSDHYSLLEWCQHHKEQGCNSWFNLQLKSNYLQSKLSHICWIIIKLWTKYERSFTDGNLNSLPHSSVSKLLLTVALTWKLLNRKPVADCFLSCCFFFRFLAPFWLLHPTLMPTWWTHQRSHWRGSLQHWLHGESWHDEDEMVIHYQTQNTTLIGDAMMLLQQLSVKHAQNKQSCDLTT